MGLTTIGLACALKGDLQRMHELSPCTRRIAKVSLLVESLLAIAALAIGYLIQINALPKCLEFLNGRTAVGYIMIGVGVAELMLPTLLNTFFLMACT